MNIFEQGDAIRIEITVKKRAARVYSLYNPSNGCKITLYDHTNDAVITDQSFTNEGTGYYYYNWQSLAASERGIYRARIVADDGTIEGVVEEKIFKLK
jgi:hypothetical protein